MIKPLLALIIKTSINIYIDIIYKFIFINEIKILQVFGLQLSQNCTLILWGENNEIDIYAVYCKINKECSELLYFFH